MTETPHENRREVAPRKINAIFIALVMFLMVALLAVEVGLYLAAELYLGWTFLGRDGFFGKNLAGALMLLDMLAALFAAMAILRRLGLSRDGTSTEEYARVVNAADECAIDGVIEIRPPLWVSILPLILGPFLGLLGGLAAWFEPRGDAAMNLGLILLMAGGFTACGLLIMYLHRWGPPLVRIDDAGVSAFASGFGIRPQIVPWSDVARCEVETLRDLDGRPWQLRPILKGWDGRVLLRPDLAFAQFHQQERLLKAIRARLPKAVDDFLN